MKQLQLKRSDFKKSMNLLLVLLQATDSKLIAKPLGRLVHAINSASTMVQMTTSYIDLLELLSYLRGLNSDDPRITTALEINTRYLKSLYKLAKEELQEKQDATFLVAVNGSVFRTYECPQIKKGMTVIYVKGDYGKVIPLKNDWSLTEVAMY